MAYLHSPTHGGREAVRSIIAYQRAQKLADTAGAERATPAQDDALRHAKASLFEQGDKAERS
ncbi:hypothetical protein [Streptomyces sp. NPDC059819]|uniref:hypothetical protein n=1 Tax=Streptomyces sp. NPDC059819 TaxID=3346963 RepID=UPI00365065F3